MTAFAIRVEAIRQKPGCKLEDCSRSTSERVIYCPSVSHVATKKLETVSSESMPFRMSREIRERLHEMKIDMHDMYVFGIHNSSSRTFLS